jgi:proteasome lid subunit RPN8/RPN11
LYSRAFWRLRKEADLTIKSCQTNKDGCGQTLEIERSTLNAIVRHLRDALPYEGCGLLATMHSTGVRRVMRFYAGANIDRSATRFTMDPREVMQAMDEMECCGWSMGAIVHSHPRTPATLSATDLREAYYPDALLVIVSLASPEPEIRAWDVGLAVDGGHPLECPIKVVED